jgi:hypothetical protein
VQMNHQLDNRLPLAFFYHTRLILAGTASRRRVTSIVFTATSLRATVQLAIRIEGIARLVG